MSGGRDRIHTLSMKPVNILWIMSDQHHADAWGRFRPEIKTPNLEALAGDGVLFQRAYCNNPICGPSRVGFMTGQHPHTHRILGNDIFGLDDRNPDTLGSLFRRSGWQTALIGKAHMIKKWDNEAFETIRYADLCDADPGDPLSCHYFKHLVEAGLGDAYDLGTLPGNHPGSDMTPFRSKIPDSHTVETWTGDETIRFLENRDSERPFFIQMSFQRPHEPLSLPSDRDLTVDPAAIPIPKSAADLFDLDFRHHHPTMRAYARKSHGYPYRCENSEELRRSLAHYYALIEAMDAQIGRVLEHLKQVGEYENTVVVYHADHGDFAGEHGLMLKNLGIFESVHRIPFILKYPGAPAGKVVNGLIESVDLYPTLADLAGIPVPEGVEGRSVVPVAEGRDPGKDEVVCEWDFNRSRYAERVLAIRTPDYRLVHFGGAEGGELYDLKQDPMEMRSVYDEPGYANVRAELLSKLLTHVSRFSAKSDFVRDARLAKETLGSPTRAIHKGGKSWSEVLAGIPEVVA